MQLRMTAGLIAATALAGLLAGCGGGGGGTAAPATTAASAPDPGGGDAGAGAAVYKSTCASCHAPDATGLDGLGKALVGTDFMAGQSSD